MTFHGIRDFQARVGKIKRNQLTSSRLSQRKITTAKISAAGVTHSAKGKERMSSKIMNEIKLFENDLFE